MTDETRPFARVSSPFDADRPLWFGKANPLLGVALKPNGYGLVAAAVNEQQSARERRAAVKALREAAARWHRENRPGYYRVQIDRDFVPVWIERLAAAIERGEVAP